MGMWSCCWSFQNGCVRYSQPNLDCRLPSHALLRQKRSFLIPPLVSKILLWLWLWMGITLWIPSSSTGHDESIVSFSWNNYYLLTLARHFSWDTFCVSIYPFFLSCAQKSANTHSSMFLLVCPYIVHQATWFCLQICFLCGICAVWGSSVEKTGTDSIWQADGCGFPTGAATIKIPVSWTNGHFL